MINVFDYMASLEIADVQSRAASLDITTALQSAINAVPVGGGTVYFPAGKYLHSQLNLTSNLTIKGEGIDATTLFYKAGGNGYGLRMDTLLNVRVANLTLNGNKENNTSGGMGIRATSSNRITLERVRTTNWFYDGVAVVDSTRVRSILCEFDNNSRDGASFGTSSQLTTSHCEAHDNGRFGVIHGSGCSYVQNIGNDLYSNSLTIAGAGAATVGSHDVVMVGNLSHGNTLGHGLQFNGTVRGVYSGNISRNNGISGFDYTLSSQYGVMSGNISYSNSIRGVEIDSTSFYVTATGNGVYRNGEVGISVYRTPATTLVGNFSTENGTTLTPKYGIRLWDDVGTLPSHNCLIVGNTATDDRGAGATQTHGLSVDSATGGTVIALNSFTSYKIAPASVSAGSIAYKAGNLGW